MKISAKRFLSLCLAMVIAFCSTGAAFAVSEESVGELVLGDNLIWDYNGEEHEEEKVYYYDFEVLEEGYYSLTYGGFDIYSYSYIVDEDYDMSYNDDGTETSIYYLESGNYEVVFYFGYAKTDAVLNIEYLGESITDITLADDLILNADFFYYHEDDAYYDKRFWQYAPSTITFSSGKTIAFKGDLEGKLVSDFVEGENDVIVEFLNNEVPTVAEVYNIDEFIADVEVFGLEEYYDDFVVYYNFIEKPYINGVIIEVTFTDGSKKTMEYEGDYYTTVEMPNGRVYEINIRSYQVSKNEACFNVAISDANLKAYTFEFRKASFFENLAMLFLDIEFYMELYFEYLGYAFANIADKEAFEENMAWADDVKTELLYHLQCFVNFYIGL